MVVTAELPPRTELGQQLSSLELIRSGERGKRDETIPLARVSTELSIVDDSHAEELGNSMTLIGGWGQLSSIVVRAREEDGEVYYDIIDGFHRAEGARRRGMENIEARVTYGCDDAEMYDLRILAASSVKSVQYARIAEWMTRAFELTPWRKKGLTVVQAFGLAINDRETSYKGLSPEELQGLKEWVRLKCGKWERSITGTHAILRVVANADPDLVKKVRPSGSLKDHAGRITPARLAAVALTMPGNFDAQNAVLECAVDNKLSAAETEDLAREVARAIESGDSGEGEINYALLIEDLIEVNTTVPIEADERGPEPEELIVAGTDGEPDVFVDPDEIPLPVRETRPTHHRRISAARVTPENTSDQVADLRRALQKAHEIIIAGTWDGRWWRTAPYLTPFERDLMTQAFDGEGFDITEFALDHKLTEIKVVQYMISTFLKHNLMSVKGTEKEKIASSGEV